MSCFWATEDCSLVSWHAYLSIYDFNPSDRARALASISLASVSNPPKPSADTGPAIAERSKSLNFLRTPKPPDSESTCKTVDLNRDRFQCVPGSRSASQESVFDFAIQIDPFPPIPPTPYADEKESNTRSNQKRKDSQHPTTACAV